MKLPPLSDVPIWSTSEKARWRTLSLYLIRSIVESYGGTVKVDLAKDRLSITVPSEYEAECARKVTEAMEKMGC